MTALIHRLTTLAIATTTALALTLALTPQSARATLPAVVDGEPLPSLANMLERVTPAVVNVHTSTTVRVSNPFANDPVYRWFFNLPDMPRERIMQSLGSGVIVDAERGYVLTNNHVVDGADEISITLSDGRSLDAELVGTDAESDIAVIKVPPRDLTAVPLGDSDVLRVGDFVVAVGNPFGLGQTVTSGIVSALGRTGLTGYGLQDFIQTDAAINRGNSGGALVNLRGELVGINSAIFSPSGGNVGIGFAIPTHIVRQVMAQLIEVGEVRRGTLGIDVQDLSEELANAFGIRNGRGAVITQVRPDSPSAKAGLRAGDVVVSFDGRRIDDRQDLQNSLGLLPVGTEVSLVVLRDGDRRAVDVVIEMPPKQEVLGEELNPLLDGLLLMDVPADIAAQHQIEGVVVQQIARGSRPWRAGLRAGDLIVSTDQRRIASVAELIEAIDADQRSVLFNVQRGRNAFFVLIQ